MKSYQEFMERSLTTKEKSEKERIVKGMKKNKSSFKSNYKDDDESVMYATATKLAKEDVKELGKIAKELDKASKMHKGQANRVRKHVKDMKEGKKKNCGCGKDPCITYGEKKIKEESELKKANINYKTTKKGGKTTHHVNKNDEADAQKAMKNDPKYILGKTRVKPVKEESCGKGEYYCREDKKCKPIPEGSKINKDGTLVSEAKSAAWTRKSGKNKSGGLNEKGRKSYERENPGSDLKAPSKKVGNPRRASFCARMKGMKKKLTSKKTASDPDSRINKSLRAWNCSYEPEGTPLIELNRYAKETGKNTGSINKPKGSSVEKGGSKDKALNFVRSKIRKDTGKPEGQQKKEKGVKTTAGAGKYKAMADKKRKTAADAKKRGFKSTQDYANTMARYGGKDNYDKGRGLGS